MKTLLALVLLSASAFAEPWPDCNKPLLPYMIETPAHDTGKLSTPRSECLYSLYNVVTFQKFPGGYLIVAAPYFQHAGTPAVLITNGEYDQGAGFPRESRAFYLGERPYTTITGFTITAHVFQEVKL